LAALVAVVLALMLGGPAAPYRFLEGREALSLPSSTDPGASTASIYTYKAEFDAVIRAAQPELAAMGYKESTPSAVEFKFAFFIDKGAPSALPRDVSIYGDVGTDARPIYFRRKPGWVTVIVTGRPETGFLERLRAFFGL
jgi:hypothetical protein